MAYVVPPLVGPIGPTTSVIHSFAVFPGSVPKVLQKHGGVRSEGLGGGVGGDVREGGVYVVEPGLPTGPCDAVAHGVAGGFVYWVGAALRESGFSFGDEWMEAGGQFLVAGSPLGFGASDVGRARLSAAGRGSIARSGSARIAEGFASSCRGAARHCLWRGSGLWPGRFVRHEAPCFLSATSRLPGGGRHSSAGVRWVGRFPGVFPGGPL